jgi:hypothetical protein
VSFQLFKKNPPRKILFDFLNECCAFESGGYILEKANYKSALLKGIIQPFLLELTPFYHKYKLFYIEQANNFTSFITIIRQLCKFYNIPINSKIQFSKSSYAIKYKILII